MSTYIVTGGSKGIGKEIINKLGPNNVISMARTENPNVKNILLDLSLDLNNLDQLCESLIDKEIELILCAGLAHTDNIGTWTQNKFMELLNVNLVSNIKIIKHFLSVSKLKSIILIGSYLSRDSNYNSLSYIMTKHALLGLYKSLEFDMDKNIKLMFIAPPLTNTQMVDDLEKNGHDFSNLTKYEPDVVADNIVKTIKSGINGIYFI